MESDIYQILGVVTDVLPPGGVQVQFALTHTIIQSLLIIIMIIMMMMMMMVMMIMMMMIMMKILGLKTH